MSLPLEKLMDLCKKALDNNELAIKNFEAAPFYEELIKVTEEAFKCVRMSQLKSENEELNEIEGDGDDMNIEGPESADSSTNSEGRSEDSDEDREEDFD